MKTILLGACALIAVPVVAQTVPPVINSQAPTTAMPHRGGGDRVQARADVVQRTQRLFTMLDANRDGALDQTEIAAAGERRIARRGAEGVADRAPRDRNRMFDRIDANRDGSLSRDEFAKGASMRVERRIVMRGEGDGSRGEWMGGRMGGKRSAGMGRLFGMADTNRDGRVTLQEANAIALSHFDRMDANRDGQLTREERAAGRAQWRQQPGS